MMNKKVKELVERAPQSPGVYLMKDAKGKVIYVGKAIRLRDRLRSYAEAGRDFETFGAFDGSKNSGH